MSAFCEGDPAAPILIIAMAPGREELQQQRPLVGATGKLLWSLAKRAGFSRADCLLLNTIGEWPTGSGGGPSPEQLEQYWGDFNIVMGGSSARVCLILGKDALMRAMGIQGSIERMRGYLLGPQDAQPIARKVMTQTVYKTNTKTHRKGDVRWVSHLTTDMPILPPHCECFLPTLHPAAILRSGFTTLPALAADVDRVKRALDGNLRSSKRSWTTLPGRTSGPVAFDIECPHGPIERIGMCDDTGGWTGLWSSTTRAWSVANLGDPSVPKIAHNIAFDLPRLEDAGCPILGPIFCTMLAAQMLQPDLYKGLESVASLYLDRRRWKHLSGTDEEKYNALDAVTTRDLYDVLCAELDRTKQRQLFEETVMPAVRTLIRMSRRGIKMDQRRREAWLDELRDSESRLQEGWSERTTANPRSPSQIASYLYTTLGLPPQYNKYGKLSVDEEALARLQGEAKDPDHQESIRLLLDLRRVSKLRGTYAENPLGDDGCVHPSYLPASKDSEEFGKGMAGTGRITSRDPNIQNQPPSARALYVPHNPAAILVEADYSQIELRIAAALANDSSLETALKGDVHATTQAALGCDRTRAKNITYGTLYGAGPRKLSRLLLSHGVVASERECRALQDGFARLYPDLWAWRQSVVQRVAKDYYLANPFGRRRYFYRGAGDAPAAIGFLPQSTAADILWSILTSLEHAVEKAGGALLTVVHDSVLMELPRAREDVAGLHPDSQVPAEVGAVVPGSGGSGDLASIRAIMEQPWPSIAPGFHVPVKVKVGPNWGSMSALS